jgi:hypothetical protein
VLDDNYSRLAENTDFYMMPQGIWEFFYNIYGGGPSIVKNSFDID